MITTVPGSYAVWGAAMLVFDSRGRIVLVRELEGRPEVGKQPGMRSIPMGERRPGEFFGRTAEREFLEETGWQASVERMLGFFEIQMTGPYKVGIWAYLGRLTGVVGVRSSKTTMDTPPLTVSAFLRLRSFELRPQNREIYARYLDQQKLLGLGVPLSWIDEVAFSVAPPEAKEQMARE